MSNTRTFKRMLSLLLALVMLLGLLPGTVLAGVTDAKISLGAGGEEIAFESCPNRWGCDAYMAVVPEGTTTVEIRFSKTVELNDVEGLFFETVTAETWTEITLSNYDYFMDYPSEITYFRWNFDPNGQYHILAINGDEAIYVIQVGEAEDPPASGFRVKYTADGTSHTATTELQHLSRTFNYFGSNGCDVYLLSLPAGAQVTSVSDKNYGAIEWIFGATPEKRKLYTIRDEDYISGPDFIGASLNVSSAYYTEFINKLAGKTSDSALESISSSQNKKGYAILYKADDENYDTKYTVIVVQIDSSNPYVNTNTLRTTILDKELWYNDHLPRKSDYTAKSWNEFETGLQDAKALLAALYNPDGSPSSRNIGPDSSVSEPPEDAIYQEDVDDADEALRNAYAGLTSFYAIDQGKFWQKNVSAMLNQLKKAYDNPSAYESVSHSAFKAAYESARTYYNQNGDVTGTASKAVVDGYEVQAKTLWESYYTGLKSAGDSIHVSFRVADNRALNDNPDYILPSREGLYYNDRVALSGGNVSLQNLVDAAGLTLDAKGDGSNNMYEWLVYLNGVLVRPADMRGDQSSLSISRRQSNDLIDWADLRLKDGDEVVLLLAPAPTEAYYIHLNIAAFDKTVTYLGVLQFANHAASVREGEGLTLNVSRVSGFQATYDGKQTPFSGARILAAKLDAEGKPGVYRTLDGVTDAQGKVTAKLYEAGEYVLVAFNPLVDTANYAYPSLAAAARTTITVTALDDGAMVAAKAEQVALLDQLLASCDETAVGPEKWEEIQSRYQAGKGAVNSAASLQAARDAVVAAQTDIGELIDAANGANKIAVDLMTHYLSLLPSVEQIGAGLFMQRDVARMGYAISHFGEMTAYQKAQLTGAQMVQWEALRAAYGTDGSRLPENKDYTVTVKVEGGHGADLYGASLGYNYYLADPASGEIYSMYIKNESIGTLAQQVQKSYGLSGEERIAFNFRMPVTSDFAIDHIEVAGAEYEENYTYYASNPPCHIYSIGFLTNPRSDITITIHTQSEDSMDFVRTSAKSALTAAYQGYSKASYSSANWSALTDAYNVGLAAIDAAADSGAVTSEKANAISAMGAIKTLKQEAAGQPAVGTHGTAHVIIENTTYEDSAFKGNITDSYVPLDQSSTMMTAALYALEQAGFTWAGTGGSGGGNSRDYTITYLASISKGGDTLGEFTASAKSGWMGTLNDWFVNEGFQSFSVYASNKSYQLRDGDEIRVMFTDQYGEDLSGTWGNADTSLTHLTASGGTLTPAFQSDTRSYVLSTEGSSVSVMPEAANKNFQVRIYLNETKGDNWYRRDESIPVKPGDVINIGVGDYSWPSMNNQAGNTIVYTGTWYKVSIVSSGNAASVIKLINALPAITYTNYKAQTEAVALARSAYDALTNQAKGEISTEVLKKLTDRESSVKSYKEIDNVKALLAAIPAVDKLTTIDRNKVQAAYDAYSRLDEKQRQYITVGDAAKYNDAVQWLERQGIDSPGTILGSDKAPGEGVVVAPKVTAQDGVAAASVGASDMDKAIAEARKYEGGAVVVAPEITGTASKVSVELPKLSVSAIGADTDADLTVETPVGSVTLPNGTLAELAEQAGGSTITIAVESVEKKSLTAEQRKLVGDGAVFDISILSGGKHISSFGGKSIFISLPYAMKAGESAKGVTVWYLDDSGKLTRMSCTYDEATGLASFTTTHLSNYVVGYDAWTNPYTDVLPSHWFYDDVAFATERGLFGGTTPTLFSPNLAMSRGMLAAVLYRLEGSPAVEVATGFKDVEIGKWYSDAVAWVTANGITGGYDNGFFGVNDPVTREQAAAILYRYASYKGYDVTASGDISVYTDAARVSEYAKAAMAWINGRGIVTGRTPDTLAPEAGATRAEMATILRRFIESIAP